MKSTLKVVLAIGALATTGGVGFAVGEVQAAQPHMQAALADLQAARSELAAAIPNKGGHRVRALNLVNQAITEVEAGIAVGAGD